MEITLAELNIIVDTLIGSTNLHDGGTCFRYKVKLRQEVAEKLLKEMSNINLEIKVKERNN
jgi:hypothetical protein